MSVLRDASNQRRSTEIGGFLEALAESLLQAFPENASYLGLDEGPRRHLKTRLAARSPDRIAQFGEQVGRWLQTAHRLSCGPLGREDAIDLKVVETALSLAKEGHAFGFGDISMLSINYSHRNTPYVVAQNTGAFVETPEFLASQHRIADAYDADAYLERLDAYADALNGESDRIRADAGAGVVAPRFILDRTLAQLRAGAARDVEEWQIVRTFREKLNGGDEKRLDAARLISRTRIAPALAKQITALEGAQSKATDVAGVWNMPEGEAYYAWALRASTTTQLTPDEVHAQGLDQVKELHAAMDARLRDLGHTHGTVPERMGALSRNPENLFPNTSTGRAELLAYLSHLTDEMRARMPRVFRTLTPGLLEIRRISPDIEQGAPDGYAGPGSIDGSLPGYYYINLRDTAIWPRFALPTLTYHEGIPGHVWQGEYANKLPLARSLLSFNAYAEGWALYAEQLADELGAYLEDPLGKLGYLQSLSFRACRLVVDTGLHAKRWTREEAVAWFSAHTGSPDVQIAGEVDRYCVWPAQSCSYKIGHNEINRVRASVKRAKGAAFDARDFNCALVQCGNVPLNMIETILFSGNLG